MIRLYAVSTFSMLFLAACFTTVLHEAPAPGTPLPNVIVITIDTLRADHLSCFGYIRNTSPQIDRLAKNATLYWRALSSAPWTVPTHASLFTGKYPFEHGAHTFKVEIPGNNVNPLASRHLTLAEVFKKEGYHTGAFVANEAYLSTRWQLNQGFDTYHVEKVYAATLNKRIFNWLDAHAGHPFFLFINYIDTHRPYNTTPRIGFLDNPVVQDNGELLILLYEKIMSSEGPIPTKLVRQVIDQYDTAIANVDEQIGGVLMDHLIRMGLYDNTIIVLTSDHGEFFGEHYLVTHSKDVYQEVLWVPLIIKNLGQKEGRYVKTTASSVDIPRLILSQFPCDIKEKYNMEFPNALGNHVVISENYYTRSKDLFHPKWGKRFNRIRTAIFDWPYKYIFSSDGKHELYNLESDKKESQNLIEKQLGISETLKTKLQKFQRTQTKSKKIIDQPTFTEEEKRKLKSLGYIE